MVRFSPPLFICYTATMKTNHLFSLIAALLLSLNMGVLHTPDAAAQATEAPADAAEGPDPAVMEMKRILESTPSQGVLFPEFETLAPEDLAATPDGTALLAWAREASNETRIPETTYTLYRLFKATGDRDAFQSLYFEKRNLLAREALAVLLGGDMTRLDRLNDLIWSVCEETWWVLPAHEKTEWFIDLSAAQTGAWLSQITAVLGDRLPEEIRERVRHEVTRRILDPFLEHGETYWWNLGYNNWTGVCSGAVGQAFLLMESDLDRQAKALALIVRQLERFINQGFNADGACLEGIGYWSYGLSEYIVFTEMMRARTGGQIDLLAVDKMKLIARYPLAVYLGHGTYASFADSHEHNSLSPYLAGRLAERTGITELNLLASDSPQSQFHFALRNLLWKGETPSNDLPVTDIFLPESGIIKMTTPAAGRTLVVAAKAGHNAEPHNNNDVGSFIVAVDGVVYLCDPGAGLYNKDYFGKKRYESIFANSYGHSVPRIHGQLQPTGSRFHGTLEKTGEKSALIRFEKAYELPELQEAARSITLQDGGLTLEDRFQFTGEGLEVEEALMTWQQVEVDGPVARISTDSGVLEIRTDSGTFIAENLEEICRVNKKSGVLTRITVTKPAAASSTARFEMNFHPKS